MLREDYGDNIMLQNVFYRWRKMLREDIEEGKDGESSGRL